MHEVIGNINRINIDKNEWFTKKEVARAMEKNFIPLCKLEELYDYTKGNPFLIQVYFDNYNGKINNYEEWINKCNHWKNKWIFEVPNDVNDDNGINPYYTLKHFFNIALSFPLVSSEILCSTFFLRNSKKNG